MLTIRDMSLDDSPRISAVFCALGWDKPVSQYETYFVEASTGTRDVLIAEVDGSFAGYLTIVWESHYRPFREASIPEIVDFNVLPEYRNRGIGTRLMDEAESRVARRSTTVGIGVGLYADYGPAQRLYAKRGYVPDGRGVCYRGEPVPPMQTAVNDDALNLFFTRDLVG